MAYFGQVYRSGSQLNRSGTGSPDMVATSPDIANFGANSFAVIEVENIGYTK